MRPGRLALTIFLLAAHTGLDAQTATESMLGERAGIAAAREAGTAGRGWIAATGGLLIGFFGPLSLGNDGSREVNPFVPFALGGIATVGAAWLVGGAGPDQAMRPADRGPVYSAAFEEGYRATLRRRRLHAALVGGGIGTLVGVAALAALVAVAAPIS